MKKQLLILFLSVLTYAVTSAQVSYEWTTETSNNYTYKFVKNDPFKTRFYTLKNGLTVILGINKAEPRLQTIIATKAGSNTDPANHTGLAHYLEHMLFKGTDKFGSLDWEKEKPYIDKIDELYEQYNSTKDEAKRTRIPFDLSPICLELRPPARRRHGRVAQSHWSSVNPGGAFF